MRASRRFTLVAALFLVATVPASSLEAFQPFGTDLLGRVFFIRFGQSMGSSFLMEVDQRQYLITAKHVVSGVGDGDVVEIRSKEDVWLQTKVRPIFCQPDTVDIVALALPNYLFVLGSFEATMAGALLGQDMFFLGYPFGLHTKAPSIREDFSFPFIKKGVFSSSDGDSGIVYLDGINNPGFSGGPVVFFDESVRKWKIAAVISSYRNQPQEVVRIPKSASSGEEAEPTDEAAQYVALGNSGIVHSYNISFVIKAIRGRPIGAPSPSPIPSP